MPAIRTLIPFFMKNSILTILVALCCIGAGRHSGAVQNGELKIVIIRHAEKSGTDNNLSCKGFNRSMMLPAVLYKKFGIPNKIYVPTVGTGKHPKHLRMLQTVTPLARKYHVPINSQYGEDDYDHVANALIHEKGLIIVAWEHNTIPPIVYQLVPAANHLHWRDNDYDSIWIISYKSGKPTLSFDAEHLNPHYNCNF
jgi:hypothetical protein